VRHVPAGRSYTSVIERMALAKGEHLVMMRSDAFDSGLNAAGWSIKSAPLRSSGDHARRG
jgi:hypothetical protein